MSDYTNLPRDIADCLRRGGAPLTADQVIMLAGYLAPIQEQLTAAQAENEALRARVAELEQLIQHAQVESGVCMCGDMMKDHNQASGHSPVDIWDHARDKVIESSTSESWLLRKQAEAVDSLLSAEHYALWYNQEFVKICDIETEVQRLRQQASEIESGDNNE